MDTDKLWGGRTAMNEPVVLTRLEENVLIIYFNRQEKRNAINGEVFLRLIEALETAQSDGDISVVVLTGKETDFCTGMDLSGEIDLSMVKNDRSWMGPYDKFLDIISAFPKPLLAAVKGYSVGAGATMLFYCDVVYAGESARFKFPFASLGLCTELGACYTMPLVMGPQKAAEVLLTADWIDAETALELGMIRAVFPDDLVLEKTLEKARQMARWPVPSLCEIKRCMKLAHTSSLSEAREAEIEGIAKLVGTPENIEAFTAFIEKREPDFRKLKK